MSSRFHALVAAIGLGLAFCVAACGSGDDSSAPITTNSSTTLATSSSTETTATTTAVATALDPDSIETVDDLLVAVADAQGLASEDEAIELLESLTDAEVGDLLTELFGWTADDVSEVEARLFAGVEAEDLATFEVNGDRAVMVGVIGSDTPAAVRQLVSDHPGVTTIVLQDVPGSIDDEANLEAARLVREGGLGTHVPADGVIASGGVDFFLAGATRTFDDGAMFGVHSWAAPDGTQGIDVPRDDPQHDLYLDYYAEVGIDAEFYWFTLDAAPADGIHYMTPDELATYGFATP